MLQSKYANSTFSLIFLLDVLIIWQLAVYAARGSFKTTYISYFDYSSLLVLLRIYVALAIFQPYRDLEAGDNLTYLWNSSGETGNRTPNLLLRKPRA